ncbi:MAG: M23 family metallopeptidase [Deltaproteobacteria bacterium]|nr:M23 family metallopeptidase [Deltaproteobacteria bacterium]
MKMMTKSRRAINRRAVLATLIVACALAAIRPARAQVAPPSYAWPLQADPVVTSVIFDKRNGHPHGGLDISLFGRVGTIPVVAIADGWLRRVRVSKYGYGYGLYVMHDDGRVSVYAHLDRFSDRIEAVADELRRKTGRENIDYYFEDWENHVKIRRGEVIAYGGKTGTRTPHLHFELRANDSDPVNPLTNGLGVPDSEPPRIDAIALVPADEWASADGAITPVVVSRAAPPEAPVRVSGRVGVAVDASDRHTRGGREFAPYRLTWSAGGAVRFETRFERFSYEEPSVERTHVDVIGKGRFYRVYNPYPAKLPHFSAPDAGTLADLPPGVHEIRVEVFDAAGNSDAWSVPVEVIANPDASRRPWPRGSGGAVLDHHGAVATADGRVTLRADAKSLYEPIRVTLDDIGRAHAAAADGCVSVRAPDVQLRRPLRVVWSLADVDEDAERLAIARVSGRGVKFLGRAHDPFADTLEGEVDEADGDICLLRDTAPPRIEAIAARAGVKRKRRSTPPTPPGVRLTDAICGVEWETARVEVDGKLAVMDVHEKAGEAFFAARNAISDGEHAVRASAEDRCGNAISADWRATF